MKFGPVAIGLAEGGILAHSLTLPGKKLAKGRRLSREDCAFLRVAGIEEVTVARLEADDLGEDDAATFLSRALVPDPEKAGIALTPAHTGRGQPQGVAERAVSGRCGQAPARECR
jgi:molybdenum cofactor cytidylyltransferase